MTTPLTDGTVLATISKQDTTKLSLLSDRKHAIRSLLSSLIERQRVVTSSENKLWLGLTTKYNLPSLFKLQSEGKSIQCDLTTRTLTMCRRPNDPT